jgi:hypothetical protein
MGKLEQVAGIVDNIGTLCENYNLEEKDIPPGLRGIFESLMTYVIHSSNSWLCFILLQ